MRQTPINLTKDGCTAAITTRSSNIGWTNILSLGHYPATAVMIEREEE